MADPIQIARLAAAHIRAFEGCELRAYPDPASPLAVWKRANPGHTPPGTLSGAPWTVGYGATSPDIGPTTVWTQAEADADLVRRAAGLTRRVCELAPRTLPDACLAALVSFAYNLGTDALAGSTLLRRIARRDLVGAADEFGKWVHAKGQILPGLVDRRFREAIAYAEGLDAAGVPGAAQKASDLHRAHAEWQAAQAAERAAEKAVS